MRTFTWAVITPLQLDAFLSSFPSYFLLCIRNIKFTYQFSCMLYKKEDIAEIIDSWKQVFEVVVSFHLELLSHTLDMHQSLKNQRVFIYEAVIFYLYQLWLNMKIEFLTLLVNFSGIFFLQIKPASLKIRCKYFFLLAVSKISLQL